MRGRPAKSKIRKRIASILQHTKASYGYEIYKHYKKVFGPVKMRTVYYNLQRGVLLNEFIISDIKREIGNYTWGNETERVYYTNGPYSDQIILDEAQKIRLQKLNQKEIKIDKETQTQRALEEIKEEIELYSKEFRNHTVNRRTKTYEHINKKIKKIKLWTRKPENKTRIEELEKQLKNYKY